MNPAVRFILRAAAVACCALAASSLGGCAYRDRLATIGTIMEKHSRVASWGIRTVMSPLLGAFGVILFLLLGALEPAGGNWLTVVRYGLLTVLGTWFLYYGVKAVKLTDMGNRVWKRSAEYALILSERKRISAARSTRDAKG